MLEDTYESDATDFSAQITKVKALPEQPAFYYIAAMPDNIGTVVKQMRDAGLTGPDRRRRRLRHAGPARHRRRGRQRRLLHDPRADGRRRRHGADQGVHGGVRGAASATRSRTRSRPSATTPSICSRTPSRAPAPWMARRSRPPSRRRPTSRASPAPSPSRPEAHVPQKGVTVIAIKDGAFTLAAEVVPDVGPGPVTVRARRGSSPVTPLRRGPDRSRRWRGRRPGAGPLGAAVGRLLPVAGRRCRPRFRPRSARECEEPSREISR